MPLFPSPNLHRALSTFKSHSEPEVTPSISTIWTSHRHSCLRSTGHATESSVCSLLMCRNHAFKVKVTCCFQHETLSGSSLKLTQPALFPSQPIAHPSFPCQLSLGHICLVHIKHQSQPLPQGLCPGSSLFPTPGHAPPIVLSRICSKVTKEALLLPYKCRLPSLPSCYRLLPKDTCDRLCLFAMPTRMSAPWRLQLHSVLSIAIP